MKKAISIILAVVLVLSCASCSLTKKQRFKKSFLDLFDTASTVIAYDTSQKAFDEHYEQFYNALKEYDQLYDIYNSYDGVVNLYQVNKTAMNSPVKVDEKIIDLLEFGKSVYKLSEGKTNICYGAVLSIWHSYRQAGIDNPKAAKLPDKKELAVSAKHTNIDDLIIDRENGTVFFADPEMRLDVGAIAKGYAVDRVCKWAKENIWESGAVSIGGNVYTFGYKDCNGKTLWNIGIENPDTASEDYLLNVKVTELSIVTSGDYQRYYTVDGKRYCHIIDPETMMPAQYVTGVSVICNDSALGDALSTTLFNMPIDDGLKLVESMDGVEAVWVNMNYENTYSSGFQSYIAE